MESKKLKYASIFIIHLVAKPDLDLKQDEVIYSLYLPQLGGYLYISCRNINMFDYRLLLQIYLKILLKDSG